MTGTLHHNHSPIRARVPFSMQTHIDAARAGHTHTASHFRGAGRLTATGPPHSHSPRRSCSRPSRWAAKSLPPQAAARQQGELLDPSQGPPLLPSRLRSVCRRSPELEPGPSVAWAASGCAKARGRVHAPPASESLHSRPGG
eukprot:6347966-Prymnesium_polylepis.2